jgi:hypothetical protein
MMRFVLAALLLGAVIVSPAFAEAPTGFAEFAWGTSPMVVREQLLAKRCRSSTESRAAWYALVCHNYLVAGLTLPILRLDFEPADSLAGYYMIVARTSYAPFRDLMLQRFGPPTSRSSIFVWGRTTTWSWPGVTATLIERCGDESSCVEVRTTALEKRAQQVRERERRDAVQSF